MALQSNLDTARLLMSRVKQHAPHVLGYVEVGVTKICLDGFPRSGNSILWHKFMMSNKAEHLGPVVSHHVHEPANIRAAILAEIPVIMPLRAPADAIASAQLYYPDLSVQYLCQMYIALNNFALHRGDAVLCVPTQTVFRNFNSIIESANSRFGRAYNPIAMSDDEANGIIATGEAERASAIHGPKISMRSGVPNPARDELKARAVEKLVALPQFRACERLFERLCGSILTAA